MTREDTAKVPDDFDGGQPDSHEDLVRPEAGASPRHIVGIGASAGGLEALERFFERVPLGTGLAFVVVQHLSPDFKSFMDELLSRHTRIPVRRVEDGMAIEADTIYLIPPRKEMITSDGRLLLTDKDRSETLTLPIDHFFRSLAQDAGERAIGIVLSGTGTDGSRGIRAIHEAGGLVFVQSVESAKFDGMPRSALDTGVADLVLPPEDMPGMLLRYIEHPLGETAPQIAADTSAETPMESIYRLLRDRCGIDFTRYKTNTVMRRTERRLLLNHASGLDDYVKRLESDPVELNHLYRDLLIGVTRFFRDPEAFARIETDVLPALLHRVRPDDEFRAWVVGCATGEEAYSLAILVQEQIEALRRPIRAKIFATDVHRTSLDVAGQGVYSDASLADVGAQRIARHFVRKSDGYQVSQELRQMVVFAQHNIVKDAPFTRLDLITCRNLIIYLQSSAQRSAISLFHFGLKTGGALFLGPSESPGELGDEFETIDAKWKIYRKRRDIRLPADFRLPISVGEGLLRPAGGSTRAVAATGEGQMTAVYDTILEEHMPPSLLVDENRAVLQVFGGASRYLRVADGRVSTDVLEMVVPELRTAVSGAVHRACRDAASVVYKSIPLPGPEGTRLVNLTAKPIRSRRSSRQYTLVLLEEAGELPDRTPAAEIDLRQASDEQLRSLEMDLHYTKENLQATIEELETSNEELQAANEELVASNEELQSTNEELHSVNEELYTVNAEYQKKIAELTDLNADMDSILASTQIQTLFLDENLCIRKFTPKIAEQFNLLPQDIGRRFDSFTHHLRCESLVEELRRVLESGAPFASEIQDRGGRWFQLRIQPYCSSGLVRGVVLTLIDVSSLKLAEAEALASVRLRDQFLAVLSHELRTPMSAVLGMVDLALGEALSDEVRDWLQTARQSADILLHLLNELLDFSRIEAGRLTLESHPFRLRSTVEDTLKLLRVRAEEKRLELTCEVAPDVPDYVLGDAVRLRQVLVNLINNAIKFTEEGRVAVLAEVVTQSADEVEIQFTVRDSGIGIAVEDQARIFSPFAQVDASHARRHGGTGLGLTIAASLVDLMGGRLWLESRPRRGSTFFFTVRLLLHANGDGDADPGEARPANGEPAELPPLDTPLCVLLVEDTLANQKLVSRILEKRGHRVEVAANGLEAILHVTGADFDVILMDVQMPTMDGLQATAAIRAMKDPKKARVPIIAMTAHAMRGDREHFLAAGMDAYVTKPIHRYQLIETVESLGTARPSPAS